MTFVKTCRWQIALIVAVPGMMTGTAIAQTCPSLSTDLGTVVYDQTNGATATFSITSATAADATDRTIELLKQNQTGETEGIEYNFTILSPPNASQDGVTDTRGSNWRASTSGYDIDTYGSETVVAGGSTTISAQVFFPSGQMLSGGEYDLEYVLLQAISGSSCTQSDEIVSSFSLVVGDFFQIRTAGGGTRGQIDFGTNFAQNEKLSINLALVANAPYKVSLDSEHDGVMKLGNDNSSVHEVTYDLTLGGAAFVEGPGLETSASNGTGGPDSLTTSGYTELIQPLEVTITGDTTTKPAGNYKDTLTITIGSL